MVKGSQLTQLNKERKKCGLSFQNAIVVTDLLSGEPRRKKFILSFLSYLIIHGLQPSDRRGRRIQLCQGRKHIWTDGHVLQQTLTKSTKKDRNHLNKSSVTVKQLLLEEHLK